MLLNFIIVALLCSSPAKAEIFRLDPSTGSFHVLLYKGGPLRALGHDHVVAARAFEGEVEITTATSKVSLSVDAVALIADEAQTRKALNMSEIIERDRAKIEARMRGPKGLDVAQHPRITLESELVEAVYDEPSLWLVTARFSLHGATQTLQFPVTAVEAQGGRWFSGYVRLRPSEYGIPPYSAFAGALTLKDEALVRFNLFGRRE